MLCGLLATMAWPASAEETPAPGAAESAYQQRLEVVERATALLKGELAAAQRARETVERRPATGACLAAVETLAQLRSAWADLLKAYGELETAAAPFPDRRHQALLAAEQCRAGRDAVQARALTLADRCGNLSPTPEPEPAQAVPILRCRGTDALEVDGELLVDDAPGAEGAGDAETFTRPQGGLLAARRAAALGAATLPEILLVRVGDPDAPQAEAEAAAHGEQASVYFSAGGGGPMRGRGAIDWLPGPTALRAVIVLPAAGRLADLPLLRNLARAFLPSVSSGGCVAHELGDWMLSDLGGQIGLGRRLAAVGDGTWALAPGPALGAALPYAPGELSILPLAQPVAPTVVMLLRSGRADRTGGRAIHPHTCRVTVGATVPPGGEVTLGIMIAASRPLTPAERLRQRRDVQMFAAEHPDDRFDRLNFHEATGGRGRLRVIPWTVDSTRSCTSGVPDLP